MGGVRSIFRAHGHVGVLIAGLVAVHASPATAKSSEEQEGPATLVGKPAPPLAFHGYGSTVNVDINDLRGKMVVVDFFRCETSKDSSAFDDVVQAEHDYGAKGVVILGVGMDENNSNMVEMLRNKPAVDWPIDYDGLGFASTAALQWKASKQTGPLSYETYRHIDVIVSPDGTVLWSGLPDQLDRAIEDQLKDHKPQLVDNGTMADAKAALDKTQAAITANQIGEAYHDRKRIPQSALQDDDFAAQVKDADDKLQVAGDAALAAVEQLIASKDYATAMTQLKDLSSGADGTPLGNKAKQKLYALEKDPDAHAALQTAEKNAKADDALKVAQKLQANKRDVQAYARFKFVAKQFPDSPAAKTATDAIAAYDADPEFKKKLAAGSSDAPAPVNASVAAPDADAKPDPARAKSLLSLANSYRDSGNTDKAREKYQAVITQFPGTPEADTAKDELAKLAQ
jgi:TolA-binding protein